MSSEILVTGGSGQLASALARAAPDRVRVVGRPDFDFENPGTLDALFINPPRVLVNAAAWTAVDTAETETAAADRANHLGPQRLAELCARHGTKFVHISTDYVFDGEKGAPYSEDDATNPTGVYGATKRAGEIAVLAALPAAIILRTSWVYATHGKNFVLTMLNAARRVPRLKVVADQIGGPTNADDLAAAVLACVENSATPGGIFHATGTGHTSWHGFATAIFEEAAKHGWPAPPVDPIATADWPTPARRPADSRLDCTKLASTFGATLPPWRESLVRAIATITAPPAA